MKKYVHERISLLQKKLADLQLDAALIYDRENLIYFAGVTDLEGSVLCIPARGEAQLFCIWMEAKHMKESTGLNVTGFPFPAESQSSMAAKWLSGLELENPKVGFTRYFISLKDYQCLMAAVPGMIVGDIAVPCYQIRSIKCPEEISRMRKASEALKAGMEAAVASVRPGIAESRVLAEAEYAMNKAGSQGSPFRMQVLTHSRQMQKHPYAGGTPLEGDAPVVIHLGAAVDGYASKMCRTVFLGKPDKESVRIYTTLEKIQSRVLEALKPGVTCGELYDISERTAENEGYKAHWIMEHIGYGVGIRQSEFYPVIAKGSSVKIEENMVVDLLLPSIYVPKFGGPRLTDTILVTKDGNEFLTDFDRAPIFL